LKTRTKFKDPNISGWRKFDVGDIVMYENQRTTIERALPDLGGWWYELRGVQWYVSEKEISLVK